MERLPVDFEIEKQGESLALSDYLGVFARRFWMIIIPAILLTIVAASVALLMVPQYRVKAEFRLNDMSELESGIMKKQGGGIKLKAHNKFMRRMILRTSFLEPLLVKHSIDEGFDISDPAERVKLRARVIQNLKPSLVTEDAGPEFVTIEYQGRDARKITNFVNDVCLTYQREFVDDVKQQVQTMRKSQEKTYQVVKKNYEAARDRLHNHLQEYELHGDLPLVQSMVDHELTELIKQRNETQLQLKSKRAELESINQQLLKEPVMIPGGSTTSVSEEYEDKEKALREAEQHLKLLVQGDPTALPAKKPKLPNHPEVLAQKMRVEVLREELNTIPREVVSSTTEIPNDRHEELLTDRGKVEREIESLSKRVEGSREFLTRLQNRREELPDAIALAQRYEAEVEEQEDAYTIVSEGKNALDRVIGRVESESLDWFTAVKTPFPEDTIHQAPVFPNVPLFIGIGLFMGLLLGVGLAFIREFSTSSFVTVGQVERTVGIPMLGHVQRIESQEETSRRRWRTMLGWGSLLLLLVVLGLVHLCYFKPDMQQHLPRWLFDAMKRTYGAR